MHSKWLDFAKNEDGHHNLRDMCQYQSIGADVELAGAPYNTNRATLISILKQHIHFQCFDNYTFYLT